MSNSKNVDHFVLCVKDNRHIFNKEVYKLTGLTIDEVRKKHKVRLGFQILPGQQVSIIADEILTVGKLQYNISDIHFVYDHQGITKEIKQRLITAGCHYVRVSSPKGWFHVDRMDYQKALTVDVIRFSSGFINTFWRSNLSNRLAMIQALFGFASDNQKLQFFKDKIGDTYQYGRNCHSSILCNLSEATAADVTWRVTNELLGPCGIVIRNRVSSRLFSLKRVVGNYKTMARTKGDVLFNHMFILCEEELWVILEELGLKYLGVGGFNHFSYYSDLSWMGLVLDLCEALKFAGHVALVKAIVEKRITDSCISSLDVFRGEVIYVVNKKGGEVLHRLKQELLSSPCYFNGRSYQTFREACKQFIVEFDKLLSAVHQRFLKKQLLVKIKNCDREIPVRFWRLATQWTSLEPVIKEQLKELAFKICQEEILKTSFKPLIYFPMKQTEEKANKDLAGFNLIPSLFETREEEFLEKHDLPSNKFSPRVVEYCNQFEELDIEWIHTK